MAASNAVACTAKTPIPLKIGERKVDFFSGCSVLDVSFPNVFYVEVGEINFKNYYSASVSVKARVKEQPTDDVKWRTCVRQMQLMPDPHCEAGSEDYFSIPKKQMTFELTHVVGLRFILRQPSPVWKEFHIDNIQIYRTTKEVSTELPLPIWLKEAPGKDDRKKEIRGIPSMEGLAASLQQLWAYSNQAATSRPKTSVGRYDVDGSYEINLLSYT